MATSSALSARDAIYATKETVSPERIGNAMANGVIAISVAA